MPGRLIQRRAPLISTPCTSVHRRQRQARSADQASRRICRGDSSETEDDQPGQHQEHHLLQDEGSRETWMRSATAGRAASIMM
jgi:hypothetical protein